MKLRLWNAGGDKKEEAARRKLAEARQVAIDQKRQIFDAPMLADELTDCLKVPYEHKLLRAVVQVVRTLDARYDLLAMQKPMDDVAHEMTARKAALRDLEEELLGSVDKANEDGVKS
jgi:hypothetical protein